MLRVLKNQKREFIHQFQLLYVFFNSEFFLNLLFQHENKPSEVSSSNLPEIKRIKQKFYFILFKVFFL